MKDIDLPVMTEEGERPLRPALLRGWKRRCPGCGSGPLFKGYLTVRRSCPVCGEALHHQRADDGPAWATILVAGHLMAPLMLLVYLTASPPPWAVAVGFSLAFLCLALYLLPRIKGMFVAFQWARRMHGFGGQEG
ncbi:MAG: DUF983 domain-containing protein [Alphaproteobacteria bacterium]|nr:MAG: DUF983 domain-containing protein [Alphaproteobacteria bacterium]